MTKTKARQQEQAAAPTPSESPEQAVRDSNVGVAASAQMNGDRPPTQRKSTSALRDLLILFVIALLALVAASLLDAFEWIAAWSSRHERWEIDELLTLAMVLGVGLGIFSFRQWREAKDQLLDRKRAEEALRDSEAKYRDLIETVAVAAFIFHGTRIRYVNSAAEAMTGYTREELLAMNFWDVIEPGSRELVRERGLQRQRDGQVPSSYEVKILSKSGEEKWVDFTAGIIEFEGRPAVLGTAFDITERRRMEEALQEQARRDPLTGALNHAAIAEVLREQCSPAPGAPCAVAMVDVDGLKAINDTYGHQVGDAVLVAVASALSRDGGLVGRYGGDEFVALLPGADRAAAERYRDEVRNQLERVTLIDPESGASVPVVASIGLAIYPEEADTVADLIRLSDAAMYASRRQRTVGSTDKRPPLRLRDDRAAEMVGEIVPLLTSEGDLNDKLRLVAHHLSVGAGYDAVDFVLFAPEPGVPTVSNTFARLPEELVEAWSRGQRSDGSVPHPVRVLLERTRRPIILADAQHDERLWESQRAVLQKAALRSALVVPMIWQNELVGALSVASKQEGAFTPRDAQFLTAVAAQVTAIMRMATLVEELQSSSERLAQAHDETVMLLAAAAEAHDRITGLHLRSVRALTEALGRELGYSEEDASSLALAAVLHDVGKFRVPDSILASTGQLADEAWELMKQHTVWGGEFLAGRPGFELAATIARSHHECWDGSGYPDGLAGEAIPEAATIVAVADAFDAMTSDRPYRVGRPVDRAVREIAACSGRQFSPKVVAALKRLARRNALPLPHTGAPDREAAA